ncbi:MAG: glutamate--tRNA ligase [Puniceicoccales bacterium]|jgi:glutamyl-tRNA synthetase|nr:glutamate--tRNA ligase [Puniceicoccales bacterium]
MMTHVRVRFAPSPTGYFHIGGARTALFNWLYAKHTNGTFVLRIEDSDAERNTKESLKSLLTDLKWMGLTWDEGPEVGGNYGPYYQSERGEIYQTYLEALRQRDRVYEKEGAIWLKVSEQIQVIDDVIHGPVHRLEEKDFVIYRSNGTPVFHFVNVVDDIAMKITHVIRGEDHLSNTSKHLELYKAWDVPAPKFSHIPLILKTEGVGKMSKRDQGSLVETYRDKFFLPDALVNYLALLGWSPKNDKDILSVKEIIDAFDLSGINKTHARFDEKKLNFTNSEHLKHLSKEEFYTRSLHVLKATRCEKFFEDDAYLRQVLSIVQEKLRSFEALPHFIAFFFNNDFEYDVQEMRKIGKHSPKERLMEVVDLLSQIPFESTTIESALKTISVQKQVPLGHYVHTLRFAVSGRSVGPGLYAMLAILGKASVLERIRRFLTLDLNGFAL